MTNIFSSDYSGDPFQSYGFHHYCAIASILIFLLVIIIIIRQRLIRLIEVIRYTLAIGIILNEFGWHLWAFLHQQWTLQEALPLHLCSFMVWSTPILLVLKSFRLFEIFYFLGISGALQSLLTPNLTNYGFPHFLYFQFFISHGFIILSALFMIIVEGYKPNPSSGFRAFGVGNFFLIVVFFINQQIGSNYMYVSHKPDTPSLLDFLGPWPWYIVGIELFAILSIGLLYLPFAKRGRV